MKNLTAKVQDIQAELPTGLNIGAVLSLLREFGENIVATNALADYITFHTKRNIKNIQFIIDLKAFDLQCQLAINKLELHAVFGWLAKICFKHKGLYLSFSMSTMLERTWFLKNTNNRIARTKLALILVGLLPIFIPFVSGKTFPLIFVLYLRQKFEIGVSSYCYYCTLYLYSINNKFINSSLAPCVQISLKHTIVHMLKVLAWRENRTLRTRGNIGAQNWHFEHDLDYSLHSIVSELFSNHFIKRVTPVVLAPGTSSSMAAAAHIENGTEHAARVFETFIRVRGEQPWQHNITYGACLNKLLLLEGLQAVINNNHPSFEQIWGRGRRRNFSLNNR